VKVRSYIFNLILGNNVTVWFSKRNVSEPLNDPTQKKLLVAMYAWYVFSFSLHFIYLILGMVMPFQEMNTGSEDPLSLLVVILQQHVVVLSLNLKIL
jgi:hypothetical protein